MLSNKQLWKGRSISAPRMRVQSLLGEGVWSEVAGSCCWKGVRLLAHMQADHEMEMEQQTHIPPPDSHSRERAIWLGPPLKFPQHSKTVPVAGTKSSNTQVCEGILSLTHNIVCPHKLIAIAEWQK